MMDTGSLNKEKINSISYNADNSFMAIATSIGFRIYGIQPLVLRQFRDLGTPLQLVELIGRTNLIGMVGQKETPFTPPNRLAIFDDSTCEITQRRKK